MRSVLFRILGFFVLAVFAPATQAAPVTHQLSADMLSVNFSFPLELDGGTGTGHAIGGSVIDYTGFPFELNDGDTIEMTVTVSDGITFNDTVGDQLEFMFFTNLFTNAPWNQATDNPDNFVVLSYDRTSTLMITDAVGDYTSGPITSSFDGLLRFSPQVNMGVAGNITDSSATIYEFTLSNTYTNISYHPGFEGLSGFNTIVEGGNFIWIDEVTPAPAPGAIALLALGLVGLGARRRVA